MSFAAFDTMDETDPRSLPNGKSKRSEQRENR